MRIVILGGGVAGLSIAIFLKKNNLLYYTNGSINLNMFIKELELSNQTKIVEIVEWLFWIKC